MTSLTAFLSDLEVQHKQVEQEYWRKVGEQERISADIMFQTESIETNSKLAKEMDQLKLVLQQASDKAREKACNVIEDVVSKALEYVFGDTYKFKLVPRELRGKPDVAIRILEVINGNVVEKNPEDSHGGGMVDIIAIAMRFAMTEIWNNPHLQGPILLDEPGKHVSEEYAIKLANFISYLQRQFNRQVIMITHQPHMAAIADTSYTVSKTDGVSAVKKG